VGSAVRRSFVVRRLWWAAVSFDAPLLEGEIDSLRRV
jgi:hypothetical protein